NQQEMFQTTILDNNDLEREKGITILAKNTAVFYRDYKINIIDTPGHADFAGEVERVISMADGALLIVDSAEGPLPQTRFVLQQALKKHLKMMVLINKVDRKDAEPDRVIKETEDLFLQLVDEDCQLEFPVLYGIGLKGVVWQQLPQVFQKDSSSEEIEEVVKKSNLEPLFEQIIATVPEPLCKPDLPFMMQVSHLDFDSYKGTYAIGKVAQGIVKPGQRLTVLNHDQEVGQMQVAQVFTSIGLERQSVGESQPGDIIALTGANNLNISQTLVDPSIKSGFPLIEITPPSLKIEISANTSPLAGREGEFSTPRLLEERLNREQRINIGLTIEKQSSSSFIVSGRGELHLAILIETMRREGYELQVGRPQVILREINQQTCEPIEELTIEITQEHLGVISEELGKRQARLVSSHTSDRGLTRSVYHISSRNLLGFRSTILTKTRGEGLFAQRFLEYQPLQPLTHITRSGVLVATENGEVTAYALESLQQRGITFVGPGEKVYAGMIVGQAKFPQDLEMNICKQKKLTNFRSNAEIGTVLAPPKKMSLEECLSFLQEDELLEVTPLNLRLRKTILDQQLRHKHTQ
ncbi:MAG TPA: GTP-binding protein, partial [Candidatus Woesebacteria bacterium]|nr:GTP-binding protein [Candidatus Woesebacteria bacterium]